MKFTFAKIILVITILLAGTSAYALTLADIELLVALGIISGEQAEIARQAISTSVDSGSVGSFVTKPESSGGECLLLNENMLLGSSGTAVSAIQKFLKVQGFYRNPEITTYYGLATKTAVIDFQIATGLIKSSAQPGAGSIGPLTREKIQEISCNALNNPIVEVNDPLLNVDRNARVLAPQTRKSGDLEIRLQSALIDEDRELGHREYRYTMDVDIDHNDLVEYWRVTLICNEDNVELRGIKNNKDQIRKCGDSAIHAASTKGNKTIKIKYTNINSATQSIGVGVEAFDKGDRIIGHDETIDNLPPFRPTRVNDNQRTSFQVVPGTDGRVFIPKNRDCDEGEQLEYLRFKMTKTRRVGDPIYPPICFPGNVICLNDYPPSYCYVKDGPSADDLCPENELFYDGRCINRQNI